MTLKLTNKSRVVIIKLFGPNKRNVAAVMINKSKKNDIEFVETLLSNNFLIYLIPRRMVKYH